MRKLSESYFVVLISFTILLSSIVGCGYKPSSYYAKEAISGNVYIDRSIDIENSSNSILLTDVLNELIISKFDAKLVSTKKEADTIIVATLNSVSHTGLQTSSDGYGTLYRANVSITVSYTKNKQTKSITVSNYYDYSIGDDSVVSSETKLEAVSLASSKALTDLFSKIAIQTF
ncbi:MAG: LPS assembly lipoprotein LptE [Campylobacterota bacterium]|nr:LPS assembly lipoprotein LptE [Campylobacterota bacterium]